MKRTKKLPSHIDSPSARARLGGTVSHYRPKEIIYSQGTPAFTLFYIQEGGVRLASRSKHHYKSPGSGGDGRHYPLANQCLHEPIPETGIH
jgi:hypothetical protein